jgi:hypothetical protein
MRCKALVAAVVMLLSSVAALEAQKKKDNDKFRLSGRVVDKATGAPVHTAVIRFEDLQRAVVADSLGRFVLEKMPAGTHYVEIARLGYEGTMEYVQIIADHDSMFVALVPQPLVLEAVTAISDRLANRRNRHPSFVRAFDTKRLATANVSLKQFLTANAAPLTTCPAGRSRSIDENCVIARGDYRQLRVYLNELLVVGAPLDLYYPHEFELVEYYPSQTAVRLYTTAFLERVAKGKAFLDTF